MKKHVLQIVGWVWQCQIHRPRAPVYLLVVSIFLAPVVFREVKTPFFLTYIFGEVLFPESPNDGCRTFKRFHWLGETYFYESFESEEETIHLFSGWEEVKFYNPRNTYHACRGFREAGGRRQDEKSIFY